MTDDRGWPKMMADDEFDVAGSQYESTTTTGEFRWVQMKAKGFRAVAVRKAISTSSLWVS